MKFIHYIGVATMLASLGACTKEKPVTPSGETDNAIVLSAGMSLSPSDVHTKTSGSGIIEGGHSSHQSFTNGTKATLRVDGLWTAAPVSKTTVATAGSVSFNHNALSQSPQLFWDDYGTADPDNASLGRAQGLTIYGAAVNGVTTAPNVSSWTALPWSVAADQTAGWAAKDLVSSNNVRAAGPDGTYKFEERAAGKLLEFTHAMSLVTVNLTAGEGFPGYTTGAANAKFQNAPSVTLLGFNDAGTVNIEAKTVTNSASVANIKAYRDNGASWSAANKSQLTALVFPGEQFADNAEILEIKADGNVYYVTAEKINAAMVAARDTDKEFRQAKNYIINVKVNKTKIVVDATIKDWIVVSASEDQPLINVSETYGSTGAAFEEDFDFFRSVTYASGYSNDAYVEHSESAGVHSYTFHDQLYWPDHNTHYFFRGVYPRVGAGSAQIPSAKVSSAVISVADVEYTTQTYPSDLAIAIPRKLDGSKDETCKVSGHSSANGICATTGTISMNFEYAMSKLQVSLKSSGTVAEGNIVDLNKVKVEIIDSYSSGRIQLCDGLHDTFTNADKADYTLHQLATPISGFDVTTLDAVVPQIIADAVKFRITIMDGSSNVTDVYETQVNLIKDSSDAVVGEWEHGKFYKYELDIMKTKIQIVATIKDWVEVNAGGDVWF